MDVIKILVLGPVSTGKTSICNSLGDISETATGENRPTKGVRCIEFIADGLSPANKNSRKLQVELWDYSGDPEYEKFWPAMREDIDGIIFVYNRDDSHQRQVLSRMYEFFVENSNFPERKCVILFNGNSDSRKPDESPLGGVQLSIVDHATRDDQIRKTFNAFLRTVTK